MPKYKSDDMFHRNMNKLISLSWPKWNWLQRRRHNAARFYRKVMDSKAAKMYYEKRKKGEIVY